MIDGILFSSLPVVHGFLLHRGPSTTMKYKRAQWLKCKRGFFRPFVATPSFHRKISEQRADTNIQQVVRLEWYLKKRQMRIPRKYNPVGTGFFFTALIPASISAVDSFSSSRACICWFRALSADDGTCPLISDLVCSAYGSSVMWLLAVSQRRRSCWMTELRMLSSKLGMKSENTAVKRSKLEVWTKKSRRREGTKKVVGLHSSRFLVNHTDKTCILCLINCSFRVRDPWFSGQVDRCDHTCVASQDWAHWTSLSSVVIVASAVLFLL
jgi:hypothetical protein